MTLKEKYKDILDIAQQYNTEIKEENGVLYVKGTVPSTSIKDRLWDIYGQIDPNFKGNDLIMNIDVQAEKGSKLKIATKESNLNIRKQPGTEYDIVGTAANGAIVTLVDKTSDSWWLIRTDNGVEGYCYAQYLEPIQSAENSKIKVATNGSNLNIRKQPGTDYEIVGKAPNGSTVTLLEKTNDEWWLVRTDDGVEGYCYVQYLQS